MSLDPNTLNRTHKIELDDATAKTLDEARTIAEGRVLQLAVGGDVATSTTRQALLVTILNCAERAFGSVRVAVTSDFELSVAWHEGLRLSQAIAHYGGELVTALTEEHPTIVVGDFDTGGEMEAKGSIVLYPTWEGWSAAVTRDQGRLAETTEMHLAGMLAGALAVSEAFQHLRGSVTAGHRDIGLSLWDLDRRWHDPDARGPGTFFLPSALWLAGLGHLGQAYSWVIALLDYDGKERPHLALQDPDLLVRANEATALLARAEDVPDDGSRGIHKTRLVARRLEQLGHSTAILERRFDDATRRQDGEPIAIVAGFDDPAPRRLLEDAGFARVFDAGLGRGPRGYLDISIHTFPSQRDAASSFPERKTTRPIALAPAYEAAIDQLVEEGVTEEAARCGIVEQIANRSVAASFVGVVAACLIVAEILRDLLGEHRYARIDLSLREPQAIQAEPLTSHLEAANYGR